MKNILVILCLLLAASAAMAQPYTVFTDPGVIIRPDGQPYAFSVHIWDSGAGEWENDAAPVVISILGSFPPGVTWCVTPTDFYVGSPQGNGEYLFGIDYAGGVNADIAGDGAAFDMFVQFTVDELNYSHVFTADIATGDLNGDLVVDLSDIVRFSRLSAGYHSLIDFNFNGAIDIGDISAFTQSIGAACATPAKGMTVKEMEALLDKAGASESASWGTVKSLYR